MADESRVPFESIEGAHEYVRLLLETVVDSRGGVGRDIAEAEATPGTERRIDALRLVEYKLMQIHQHLGATSRLLNDLRTLRRLLLGS